MGENLQTTEQIKDIIYTVRGVKIMIDADLAVIYGYTTKALNQQVKNNIAKFDDDFRFQLTKEEFDEILRSRNMTAIGDITDSNSTITESGKNLRSKNLTANSKRDAMTRTMPYAFTEQGIYMLMTVLKGELATRQSKALVRAFKEMKDFIIDNRSLIGNRELLQLAVQTSQNAADISDIRKNMVTKDDLAKVVQDFTAQQTRHEYLILNGESVDANIAYGAIYQAAKYSIYIVDNYIGTKTLDLLKNASSGVVITIFSDNINRGLRQSDYTYFSRQQPNMQISFRKTCGIYHDRYIVLDYNTSSEKIFHCGASSKDAGNKVNTIIEVTDRQVYHQIVDALLSNPVLTLT